MANHDKHGARSAHPIDLYVGSRVRIRRTQLKMSQEKLADALGVTFQQVQKYERGANRVSASRLWMISETLGVGVTYFYDGYKDAAEMSEEEGDQAALVGKFIASQNGPILMKAFNDLAPSLQRQAIGVVRALAEA